MRRITHFGESVRKPTWRGRGIGHRFFDEREAWAAATGLPTTTFCAVERAANDPRRPAGDRPLDARRTARGDLQRADLTCVLRWRNLDEAEERAHRMGFRLHGAPAR